MSEYAGFDYMNDWIDDVIKENKRRKVELPEQGVIEKPTQQTLITFKEYAELIKKFTFEDPAF